MVNVKRKALVIALTLAVLASTLPFYAFAQTPGLVDSNVKITSDTDTEPAPTPGRNTPTDVQPAPVVEEEETAPAPAATPVPTPVVTPTPAPVRPAAARPAATATPEPVQVVNGEVVVNTEIGTVVSDNTATVVVSSAVLSQSVDEAIASVDNATEDAAPVVEIALMDTQDAQAINVTLPTTSLSRLAENADAKLTLTSDVAKVSFDATALAAIADQAQEEVTLVVAPAATDDLNDAQKAAVGERPVFDLSLQNGDALVSDFNNGIVTVTLPYTLAEDEEADGLVVLYVDDEGTTTPCTTSYDAQAEEVSFETTHFSKYVIGYEAPVAEQVAAQPADQAVEAAPAQEGSSFPVVPVAIVCVVIVVILAVVIMKRSGAHKA